MDLDSVRSLKAEVLERVVAPLVEERVQARAFGLPATSLRRAGFAHAAVALGVAQGIGKRDFQLALRIQRRSLERDGRLADLIARAAQGEVETRYIGRLTKQDLPWHQARSRPLLIGASVGHHAVTAGTIGCFVRHRKTGKVAVLSNNHVLANEDRAKIGDAVIQPGAADGGTRKLDTIGALTDWTPLKTAGNLVDAAIATLASGIDHDPSTLTTLGRLNGVRRAPIEPGERVMKVGRTTGATHGTVTAIELDDVVVGYERGELSFDSQIEIEGGGDEPFSAGGDSGSLIVDEGGLAAALLFAGGDMGGSNGTGLTFANDVNSVLASLNIELVV